MLKTKYHYNAGGTDTALRRVIRKVLFAAIIIISDYSRFIPSKIKGRIPLSANKIII